MTVQKLMIPMVSDIYCPVELIEFTPEILFHLMVNSTVATVQQNSLKLIMPVAPD